MPDFELVLPAFNEAATLPALLERAVVAAENYRATPQTFGLVLVDNGSTDDSAEVLRRLKSSPFGAWLRVVHVPVNKGYGHGLLQGLQATSAPVIGYSHADMQCDPMDAFAAYELHKAQQTPTLVKGTRSGRLLRDRFVSGVFAGFARAFLNLPWSELNAQPKVFDRQLLQHLSHPPKNFAFDLYLQYRAYKAGYRLREIAVRFPPRPCGSSKWAATLVGRYRTILGMIGYMWFLRRREGRL